MNTWPCGTLCAVQGAPAFRWRSYATATVLLSVLPKSLLLRANHPLNLWLAFPALQLDPKVSPGARACRQVGSGQRWAVAERDPGAGSSSRCTAGKEKGREGPRTVSTALLCCSCFCGTAMCTELQTWLSRSRINRQPSCNQLNNIVFLATIKLWCNNLIHSLFKVDESNIFCNCALKWNKTLLAGASQISPFMNFDWFPWKHWHTPFSTRVHAWTKELLNEVAASSYPYAWQRDAFSSNVGG